MPSEAIGVRPAGAAFHADGSAEAQRRNALLKAGALQNAILNSANFSIIATDEKGIIQLLRMAFCSAPAFSSALRRCASAEPSEWNAAPAGLTPIASLDMADLGVEPFILGRRRQPGRYAATHSQRQPAACADGAAGVLGGRCGSAL